MLCQRVPLLVRILAVMVVGLWSSPCSWAQNNGGHGGGGHTLAVPGWRGGYGDGFRGGYPYRYGRFYGYPGWYGLGFGLGYGLGCTYGYPYYPYVVGYPVYVTPDYPPPGLNAPLCQVAGEGSAPPGAVRLTDTDVLLSIRVPPDAIVRINGERTRQSGPRREFVSSGLAPGRTYTFAVTARWTGPDGQAVELEQRVHVQGGERRNVDFLTASPPLPNVRSP